ncbi:hypothetical protein HN587_02620 [Candidatus Woesearchaeota archaeon]|jgi:hypothetical protein|nr:hypothetical protein [Candidatus Woesearchaeota archaeon]
MIQAMKSRPFKQRLKDMGYLLKHSFTVIGKDKDIKTPIINMCVFSGIIISLIFLSLLSFFTGTFVFGGVIILLFTVFFLGIYVYFYNVRQKANLSWIVFNTITGVDISYLDAHNHTKTEKGKLRLIALIDWLMSLTRNRGGEKKGILSLLVIIFFAALREVWDLLSHYMIPAVVIEKKPLNELIVEIKSLKDNIPATLMGVFGIDFAGSIVGSFLFPIYLIIILIGVGIGYLISLATTITVITISGFSFSWVPVLITAYLVFLVGACVAKFVDSIKMIYFTIFYTSLRYPNKIVPEMKQELTNYLVMNDKK